MNGNVGPEELADFLSDFYGTVLDGRAILTDTKFQFTRSVSIDGISTKTDERLVEDFDRIKKKTIKTWMDVARKKKLQTGESEANFVIDTSVTGNELTVSIIEGQKSSFLYGYGQVASGLGFSSGDAGRVGTFDFDFMPKAAFERAKKSASRISNNTINNMMRGDKAKFAKRNVRNIIKEGIRTGKADSDIAKQLGEFFDDSKYWKAAEITRTEIPLAYNYGRIDAARTDGLKKARIELGGRPCSWCIDNHTLVRTLDQAETYMDAHHPNNDCTVVPLIDFEYYGIEPPEGYYPDEEGPIQRKVGEKELKASKRAEKYLAGLANSGIKAKDVALLDKQISEMASALERGKVSTPELEGMDWIGEAVTKEDKWARKRINKVLAEWMTDEDRCKLIREAVGNLYKGKDVGILLGGDAHIINRISEYGIGRKPKFLVRGLKGKLSGIKNLKKGGTLIIDKPSSFSVAGKPNHELIQEGYRGKTSLIVHKPKSGSFFKNHWAEMDEDEYVSKGIYEVLKIEKGTHSVYKKGVGYVDIPTTIIHLVQKR